MFKKNSDEIVDKSLKNIFKTSLIVFLYLILSKIFTYLYKIIIARNFGTKVYGSFSLMIFILTLFSSVASLGLQEGLNRYVPVYISQRKKEKISYSLKFSIRIVLVTSIVAGFILILLSRFISENIFKESELSIYLIWAGVITPIYVIGGFYHLIIRSYEKINLYSFIGYVLQSIIQLGSFLILMYLGFKSRSILISYSLGILSIFLGSYFIIKYKIKEPFKKFVLNIYEKKKVRKELLSYSWPLIFLGVVTFVFSWVDSFVLGFFKGISSVGIYNAAIPIAFLFGISSSLFIQLFFPLVTREFEKKELNIIKELSKQVTKWIYIINLPFLIITIFFPGAIINLFFGPDYIAGANSLRFLSIGMFFYYSFIISENLLLIFGKSKTILINLLITAIINTFLNIILVPIYGIDGAAFSTMTSYILLSFILLFESYYYIKIIPVRKKMIKILLISLIPIPPLIFLKNIVELTKINLIILGISFMIFYIFLIFISKSFDTKDLMIIDSLKKKFSKGFNKTINIIK